MTDREVAEKYLILQAVVGSTAHGLALNGQDDTDLMGVCMAPAEAVYGLRRFEGAAWRTQPVGVRSGPGDIDCTIYSLQKFCRLAVKGNPSVLALLYVHPRYVRVETAVGGALRQQKAMFLSKAAGRATYHYLGAQLAQLQKSRGGKDVKRPELVEKYGFDTKFGSHAVRLGIQGIELMRRGWMSIPLQEPQREEVLAVKRGELRYEQVCALITEKETQLREAIANAVLPDEADVDAVNKFLIQQLTWFFAKKYV